MKKDYLHPDTELLRIKLETNFLDSGSAEGTGSNLSNPFDMTDDGFTFIFG